MDQDQDDGEQGQPEAQRGHAKYEIMPWQYVTWPQAFPKRRGDIPEEPQPPKRKKTPPAWKVLPPERTGRGLERLEARYLPAVVFDGEFEADREAIAAELEREPWHRLMPIHTLGELALIEAARPDQPGAPLSSATTCPVCGHYKPPRWTLCWQCLRECGGTVAEMPAWVKWAVNQGRRWRYREDHRLRREIPLGDWEAYEGMRGDLGELPGDCALSYLGDGWGPVPLPFAPYPDEKHNHEYRRANGIRPIRTPKGAEPPGPSPDLDTLGPGAKSHHYTASRPNVPAGWLRPGSWPKEPAGLPRRYALQEYGFMTAYGDLEEARQIAAEAEALMSPRQREVLSLGAQGLTQDEIGERLGIAQSTVSVDWTRALEKLEQSRTNFLEMAQKPDN